MTQYPEPFKHLASIHQASRLEVSQTGKLKKKKKLGKFTVVDEIKDTTVAATIGTAMLTQVAGKNTFQKSATRLLPRHSWD